MCRTRAGQVVTLYKIELSLYIHYIILLPFKAVVEVNRISPICLTGNTLLTKLNHATNHQTNHVISSYVVSPGYQLQWSPRFTRNCLNRTIVTTRHLKQKVRWICRTQTLRMQRTLLMRQNISEPSGNNSVSGSLGKCQVPSGNNSV